MSVPKGGGVRLLGMELAVKRRRFYARIGGKKKFCGKFIGGLVFPRRGFSQFPFGAEAAEFLNA